MSDSWAAVSRLKADDITFAPHWICASDGTSSVYAKWDTGLERPLTVSRRLARAAFDYMPEPQLEIADSFLVMHQGGRRTAIPIMASESAMQMKPPETSNPAGSLRMKALVDALGFMATTSTDNAVLRSICLHGPWVTATNRFIAIKEPSGVDVGDVDVIIPGDLIRTMAPVFKGAKAMMSYGDHGFTLGTDDIVFTSAVYASRFPSILKVIAPPEHGVQLDAKVTSALRGCMANVSQVASGEHDYVQLRVMDHALVVEFLDDDSGMRFEETVSMDSAEPCAIQFHPSYLTRVLSLAETITLPTDMRGKAYAKGHDGTGMVVMARRG